LSANYEKLTQVINMFENRTRQAIVALLAGLTGWPLAFADNQSESHDAIRTAAHDFAAKTADSFGKQARINISVDELDSRLKLAKCDVPIEAFESPNARSAGRTTVGVRCEGESPWKLYVPVNIEVIEQVATLKQGVARNSELSATDIVMQEMDVSGLNRSYYSSKQAVLGKFVKSSLKGGTVIKPRHLENPLAVKKGTMVTILADLGGIQVRMKGKAMKSGSVGDWIAVENVSSARQIEGRILQDGVVEVML
jgi:flagella basal body P-ring formation protein FlgA